MSFRQAGGSHGGTRSSVHFTPGRVQNMPDCLRCARDACTYWPGAAGIPGVAAPISLPEKLPFPTGSALAICNPGTEGARRRLRPKPKYRARFEPSPDRQSQGTATGEQEGWAVHASIIVRRNYGKVDGGPGGAKRNCHDWSRQTQRCTSNQLVRTRGI